jgi:hypothetical protein
MHRAIPFRWDGVIPFRLAQRLFEAANEPKKFVAIPGGDHNDPPAIEYLQALDHFLGSLPALSQL